MNRAVLTRCSRCSKFGALKVEIRHEADGFVVATEECKECAAFNVIGARAAEAQRLHLAAMGTRTDVLADGVQA